MPTGVTGERRRVFVCYSHKDDRLFNEFWTIVQPLVAQGLLDVWSDKRIPVGGNWEDTILSAIRTARVAILLVSADFLASEFIQRKELPGLLDRAAAGGLTIFWVHLSACLYDQTPIAKYQAAHNVARPLDSLPKPRRRQCWTEICGRLTGVVAAAPGAASRPGAAKPVHQDRAASTSSPPRQTGARRRAKAVQRGAKPPLVLAYGDEWCDFPFYDVLDALADRYGYETGGSTHKGSLLEDLAYRPAMLSGFAAVCRKTGRRPRAIIVSAGAEDIVQSLGSLLNSRHSNRPPVNDRVLKGLLERIGDAMLATIASVHELSRECWGSDVPIILHGYAYFVPDGRGFAAVMTLVGPWLEPVFQALGYTDLQERFTIMKTIVDRLNDTLARVAETAEHPSVTYVDLRAAVSSVPSGGYKEWWANEIVPSKRGFDSIARELDRAISARS